jgi:hypothetical protein
MPGSEQQARRHGSKTPYPTLPCPRCLAPLPVDLPAGRSPHPVHRFAYTMTEVGVENLNVGGGTGHAKPVAGQQHCSSLASHKPDTAALAAQSLSHTIALNPGSYDAM